MTEIQATIVGSIIAGIAVIGSVYIGYFLSRSVNRETIRIIELHKIASEFRAAFAPAIAKFKIISDTNEINEMLREELIPQSIAIERFRPYVPIEKRDAYQDAWENYHLSHKREGVSSVYFLDYAMGNEKERFKLFEKNIHMILQFSDNIKL